MRAGTGESTKCPWNDWNVSVLKSALRTALKGILLSCQVAPGTSVGQRKKSYSPTRIQSMTSQTPGGRLYHRATGILGEQSCLLGSYVTRGGAVDFGSNGPGSSPGQGTVLCSWARHFTLIVPLSS